jgi:hypothetical protein
MLDRMFYEQVASNDPAFKPGDRHRTTPIPDSIHPISGYPSSLVVYKILASKYWQVRCFISGRLHKKSTKTTSLKVATHCAVLFYEQILVDRAQVKGLHLQPSPNERSETRQLFVYEHPDPPFEHYANELLRAESARVERGEYSSRSLAILKNRLAKWILPKFGALTPQAITYIQIQNFSNELSALYCSTTVSQYLIALRKVLKMAGSMGGIKTLPDFPKAKVATNSRGAFTPTEYYSLLRMARSLVGRRAPHDNILLRTRYGLRSSDQRFPADLPIAIRFMVNSFIRPSDIKTLKHKHVEIVHNANLYLRLTLPATKSHDKPIVTLQPAVRAYIAICKLHAVNNLTNREDYLFLPQHKDRAYALRILTYYFNWVLAETSLKYGVHGQPRSLYSLRHSSITFRLLYGHGIDLLTLARNARTGVDMINRHYASTLTAEQNIGILQSRRPQGRFGA